MHGPWLKPEQLAGEGSKAKPVIAELRRRAGHGLAYKAFHPVAMAKGVGALDVAAGPGDPLVFAWPRRLRCQLAVF